MIHQSCYAISAVCLKLYPVSIQGILSSAVEIKSNNLILTHINLVINLMILSSIINQLSYKLFKCITQNYL